MRIRGGGGPVGRLAPLVIDKKNGPNFAHRRTAVFVKESVDRSGCRSLGELRTAEVRHSVALRRIAIASDKHALRAETEAGWEDFSGGERDKLTPAHYAGRTARNRQ